MKERITILLGAGAMIDATGVSTESLTREIIEKCKKFKINKDSDDSVVDVICEKLMSIYKASSENPIFRGIQPIQNALGSEESLSYEVCGDCHKNEQDNSNSEQISKIINFEDIFHVLELLVNYYGEEFHKGYGSSYHVFSQIRKEFKELDENSAYGSAYALIDVLNDEVYKYDSQFAVNGQMFKNFFNEIENNTDYVFDVFNLNYDTWVEQSLKDYNDGYVNVPGYESKMQRFDSNKFLEISDNHTVAHLHGQIYFEYPKFEINDINKFAFQESHNTLYKYLDYSYAKEYRLSTCLNRNYTQSGEALFKTNIITGLMKTDKLLCSPMNVYHSKMACSLFTNKKLIIIGYGFPDLYINSLLFQYCYHHYNDKKVLMIDFINDTDWHPEIAHPFTPGDKATFTNFLYKKDSWYKESKYFQKEEVISSSDNMICCCGFKNACEKHLPKIIEFLSKNQPR